MTKSLGIMPMLFLLGIVVGCLCSPDFIEHGVGQT